MWTLSSFNTVRQNWGPYDLISSDGIKIEVEPGKGRNAQENTEKDCREYKILFVAI